MGGEADEAGGGRACESRTQNRLLSVAALYHGDRSRRVKAPEKGVKGSRQREANGVEGSQCQRCRPDNAALMGMLSESIISPLAASRSHSNRMSSRLSVTGLILFIYE